MGLHNAAVTAVRVGQDTMTRSIVVESPYNADFTLRAKQLGGRWDAGGKRWMFPAQRETEVRTLVLLIYGTCDGLPKPTREALRARLAEHIAAIVDIQEQLSAFDDEDEA